MSDIQGQPWSDNLYAPKITHHLYIQEKVSLAVSFISSILYGTSKTSPPIPVLTLSVWFVLGLLVILFFRCITALFDPVHRRGNGIKWGIISYTVVMFSTVTAVTGIQFNTHTLCYIDNREFPGVGNTLPPGPLGYESFIFSDVPIVVGNLLFLLNCWLADGLLVSRLFI